MTGRGPGQSPNGQDAPGPVVDGTESSGRRDAVLRELRLMGRPAGVTELAQRLGVHANTIRFHLDKLVDADRVERVRTQAGTPGRPPLLYRAVRAMDPAGPRQFALLAHVLVDALSAHPDPGGQAARAGREWGRGRALAEPLAGDEPVDRLVGLLEELGFAPEASPGLAVAQQAGTGGAEPGPGAEPALGAARRRAGRTDGAASARARGEGGAGERWLGLRRCPFLELATASPAVVCPVHLGLMQGALDGWSAQVTVDRLDPFVQPDLCLAHLAPA